MGKKLSSSLILLVLLFIFGSCIQRPTRPTTSTTTKADHPTSTQVIVPETTKQEPEPQTHTEVPKTSEAQTSTNLKEFPKFGFIFSAGGAKTWAHVGVLKELQKLKWPVQSVAGIEWGSVIASQYAMNLSVNEVEWELSKFKGLDKHNDFIKTAFIKKSTNDMKVPFVCPSLNIAKQATYLLNKGDLEQLIPYCLAAVGVMKPILNSVALLGDVSNVAQHLRATGATKVILVNVLSQSAKKPFIKDSLSAENILWSESAALMAKKPVGVDEVVNIDLDQFGLNDFDKRREIMVKGSELSYNQLKKIANKYGL